MDQSTILLVHQLTYQVIQYQKETGHHLNDSNITDDGSTVSIGPAVSITGGLVSTGSSVNLVSTIPGNFQIQKAIQYPSVDSVLRGQTFGSNFIGMLDYSGVEQDMIKH